MSQFQSRLPEDSSYWDGLAARIVDAAEPILGERREGHAWWRPLAQWSPAIGLAAAAAALLVVAVERPAPAPASPPVSFEQLLSPDDPIERALVGGAPTPDISAMLLVEGGGKP